MQYFSHPIIDALLEHPQSDKKQLFAYSGIASKREYLNELRMLEDEMHLSCEYDVCYPRFNRLVSFSKVDKQFTTSFPLNYVSYKDLRKLLDGEQYKGEFKIEYISGHLQVFREHTSFLQDLTEEKLAFDRYDYYFSSRLDYSNNVKERVYLLREWTIVHLDDHSLYGRAVEKELKKYFPNCKWNYFNHPDDALQFIENRLKEEEPIHLIVTDIQHPGLNGYEFATVVRDMEDDLHCFHSSILALTMQPIDHPLIEKGIKEKVFNEYRNKITGGQELARVAKYLFEPEYLNEGILTVDPWLRSSLF